MAGLRHRKSLHRIVLLAMTAMLWSQFALAGHGSCFSLPGSPDAPVAAADDSRHHHAPGCDTGTPPANDALCEAHCAEGELSADTSRIPSIQPLPVGAWFPWLVVAGIASSSPGATTSWVDSPPRPAWHRPTAHPAALLLI